MLRAEFFEEKPIGVLERFSLCAGLKSRTKQALYELIRVI
jgi:hypothetical protein